MPISKGRGNGTSDQTGTGSGYEVVFGPDEVAGQHAKIARVELVSGSGSFRMTTGGTTFEFTVAAAAPFELFKVDQLEFNGTGVIRWHIAMS